MDKLEAHKKRLLRERQARKEAERLLEEKSQELYRTNQDLIRLTRTLETEVGVKTRELLGAQKVARLGTLIWDAKKELITWSEGVYDVLGRDPDGEPLSFEQYILAIHEDDRERILELINQHVEGGLALGEDYTMQHRVVCPNGEVRWVQGRAEAGLDEEGEPSLLFATVQDISREKASEEELQRNRQVIERRVAELERAQIEIAEAKDAAEQASRTKSRFLAMMSHEIRTPINGVLGTLTLLGDTPLLPEQQGLLEVAVSSADALRILLNDIIDLSKVEAAHLELEIIGFDLHETVKTACEFWRPLAESKGLTFYSATSQDVPQYVEGDPARVRQVLNNLLSNAIKFTDRGGIEVNVCSDTNEPAASEDEVWIRIEVQDTGIGISSDDQQLLFEDFSQVGSTRVGAREGSGLGLAISRELATRMNGSIGVTSAPELGSKFWFRVPLKIGSAPTQEIEERRDFEPLVNSRGNAPRILVAEDVTTNQIVVKLMLDSFGCRTDIVANGVEAVSAVLNRPYDVVLMDVAMPVLGGVEATQQIRTLDAARASIPIVGLTAFVLAEERDEFAQAGMNFVLGKPVNREELYRSLQTILAKEDPQYTNSDSDRTTQAQCLDSSVLEEMTVNLSAEQSQVVLEHVLIDIERHGTAAFNSAGSRDVGQLSQSVHALKGLAATFGSMQLSKLAESIEEYCRQEDFESAISLTLSDLKNACASAISALQTWQREHGQ
jgi:signal transduction histidine kinase/DNA-binding response OmpR family regulator